MTAHDFILANETRILQSKVSMVKMGSSGKGKTGRTYRTSVSMLCVTKRAGTTPRENVTAM
jgi:hypothetical protein